MKTDLSLQLARRLSERANQAFADGSMLEAVTPVTADLLKHWFAEAYTATRDVNFHEGQRQAILNIVYLHEVVRVESVLQMYERVAPDLLPEADLGELAREKYQLPKYAVKMATGTGKTWVMHALMLWQFLNARHEAEPVGRFCRHFLVVAPGLIVYDRLLDAYKGRQRPGTAERDVETNDFHRNQELFIPPHYRDEVFSFVENNTVDKEDGIGRKVTGDGLIALTNWQQFLPDEEETLDPDSPRAIARSMRPLAPGTSTGNTLEVLDRRRLGGETMDYLATLPELMVINDEAHHIHETKRRGEVQEVEWQKGLDYMARGKKGHFFQLDFSATPYDTVGAQKTKHYFPHIVVDFDLFTAVSKGLVKIPSIDKRKKLTELEQLDYRAVCNERGEPIALSDGQRLMLRAGLGRLRTLEAQFTQFDAGKHPKMLVVCEDTKVTPRIVAFLQEEGLGEDDVLRIDSAAKGDIKPKEWKTVKERLFNVDRYAKPRVIVSVLMLREGFDVNNICVIVPLRSAQSSILAEQIVGRGLRLMWREPKYREAKDENRRCVLVKKLQPESYLDMLFIIEHPAFQQLYDELIAGGAAVSDESDLQGRSVTGDLIRVGLKADYADYDLFWPTVLRDTEKEITPEQIDPGELEPFTAFPLSYLRQYLATEGETFVAEAMPTKTLFGQYKVSADLFTAYTYNEYLQKLLRIVTTRMDHVGKHSTKPLPTLQINQAEIVRLIDTYIRTRLFGRPFDPFGGNDWKILLAQKGVVTQHIVRQMSVAIHRMQEHVETNEAVVEKTWFSSVPELHLRERYSVEVQKTIYERLGYPSNSGGLERAFAEFLDRDGGVECFLKIHESQHPFAVLYYLRTDGLLAHYHPDFLVRTATHIYVVETKGDDRANNPNVQQKRQAAALWCRKISALPPDDRMQRTWEYVLLPESSFYLLAGNGATLEDMCRLNHISPAVAGELFYFDES